MKIVRQSDTELVLESGSLWTSVLLAIASLPLFYAATLPGEQVSVMVGIFFLVAAVILLRRTTIVFDAAAQIASWKRLHFFRVTSGSIPFAQITGIGTETTSGSSGSTLHRLTLLTAQKPIPLSDSYSSGRDSVASLRKSLQSFMESHGHAVPILAPTAPPLALPDPEAAIRSLIRQGRKLDAIRLLESSRHIGMAAATQRVEDIAARMRTKR